MRLKRCGRLHGGESQDLEQVGDHHVLVGTGGLIKTRTLAKRQCFRDINLHILDEVAVPDRLEDAIGESEHEQVLNRFLTQVVIDAIDLAFVENLVDLPAEFVGALPVDAKRFLDDDATIFSGHVDQLGGPEPRRKKYLTYRFRELLKEIHHKDFHEQKEILDNTIEEWLGERKQNDDILVLGFKILVNKSTSSK